MQKYSSYIIKSGTKVLEELGSSPDGLGEEEVKQRLQRYGQNVVEYEPPDWRRILIREIRSFFVFLLFLASLFNFLVGNITDAAIIIILMAIFILTGFFQEYRAEQKIYQLRTFLKRYATVKRDGKIHRVDIRNLVPGDIVLLKAGDMIPADLRILHAKNLMVDESLISGESLPASKDGSPIDLKEIGDEISAKNLAFFGSVVVEGWAHAVVIGTGKHAYFAQLFEKLNEIDRPSLFEKKIKEIAKFISNLILFFAAITFFAKTITSARADIDFLVFIVALIVAVVPEALPLVVTLAFSTEALKLAKRKVVIRRLTAIEDLGNIEIICTDKTGTITKNHLTLTDCFGSFSEKVIEIAALGIPAEKFEAAIISPFDRAIFEKSTIDVKRHISSRKIIDLAAFDPIRRINSVFFEDNKKYILVIRGAPESVLERSSHYLNELGQRRIIDESYKQKVLEWFRERGKEGKRVLALAYKNLETRDIDIAQEEKSGMVMVGMLAFSDPLKETAKPAFEMLRSMGIGLKIISGDSPEVVAAVGYELGLIQDPKEVITGEEFSKLSAKDKLAAVKKYNVFARTLPMHKYEIIETMRKNSVVGFLGEGFNDLPALKIADLALTVDNASDMARNVGDIILLESDLMVIAEGVMRGRKIFLNVMKYIRTTLAANIGNFFSVTFSSLLLPFLPMLPAQILLVNFLTDAPMISISIDNVLKEEIAKPLSYDLKNLYPFVVVFGAVSALFDFIFFGTFLHFGEKVLQSGWFLFSILTEILVFLSLRSILPIFKAGIPNLSILMLSVFSIFAAAALIFDPRGQTTFKFVPLSFKQIAILLGILLLYLFSNEMVKIIYKKYLSLWKRSRA